MAGSTRRGCGLRPPRPRRARAAVGIADRGRGSGHGRDCLPDGPEARSRSSSTSAWSVLVALSSPGAGWGGGVLESTVQAGAAMSGRPAPCGDQARSGCWSGTFLGPARSSQPEDRLAIQRPVRHGRSPRARESPSTPPARSTPTASSTRCAWPQCSTARSRQGRAIRPASASFWDVRIALEFGRTRTRRSTACCTTSSRTSGPSSGRERPSTVRRRGHAHRRGVHRLGPRPAAAVARTEGALPRPPAGGRCADPSRLGVRQAVQRADDRDRPVSGRDLVWDRFESGRDDRLWYYRSLVAAFRANPASPSALVDALERTVDEMGQLATPAR